MISAPEAIEWTTRLAGLCAAILSAEILLDHRHYADDGLLGWPVMQTRHRALVTSWYAPLAGALLKYRVFLAITVVRLLVGLILTIFAPGGVPGATLIALATVGGLAFQLRTTFGTDGADQVNELVLASLLLNVICASVLVRAAVLWFLALQLALSYFIAGVSKLCGEEWRMGRAPFQIFSTRMYGIQPLGWWLKRNPLISTLMSWTVMAMESSFPLVFIAPRPAAIGLIVGGLAFHIITAVVMGLNTFFWAFVALYPALFWCVFGR
jgi:hypothetical protein